MTDFTKEMDDLAATLAKDANMAEKNFGDRLDAFKVLMPYYALQMKKVKDDDGDADLPNFDSFNTKIHAVK
jgi:hypothetical protein